MSPKTKKTKKTNPNLVMPSPETIREDKRLRKVAEDADGALSRLRWEACECKQGLKVQKATYAKAVGTTTADVTKSVQAWERSGIGCTDPTHGATAKQAARRPSRIEQRKNKALAGASTEKTLLSTAIASEWDVTVASAVGGGFKDVLKQVRDRANDLVMKHPTESELTEEIVAEAARQVHYEVKKRDELLRYIRRTMLKTRGLTEATNKPGAVDRITNGDVEGLLFDAEAMVKKGQATKLRDAVDSLLERDERKHDLFQGGIEVATNADRRELVSAVATNLSHVMSHLIGATQKLRGRPDLLPLTGRQVTTLQGFRDHIENLLGELDAALVGAGTAGDFTRVIESFDWDSELAALLSEDGE